MAKPIVIDIPHQLGKEEARRRMAAGAGKLAQHIPGGAEVSSSWPSQDRMHLAIRVMGQEIGADLLVEEAVVKVELAVPLMLSMMSGPISAIVRRSAEDLLLTERPAKE